MLHSNTKMKNFVLVGLKCYNPYVYPKCGEIILKCYVDGGGCPWTCHARLPVGLKVQDVPG